MLLGRHVAGLLAIAATLFACVGTAQDQPVAPQQRPRQPRIHDPSTIVRCDETYWTYTTGPGVSSWKSKDLKSWERVPAVFPEPPKWITDVVPDQRGFFWAPDVIQIDGRWFVYYSVSTFGKQTSAIALATSPTLNPDSPSYKWADEGIVIQTNLDSDYNAIDPSLIRTQSGELWMAFGSFWSGIKLIQLDPRTGKRIVPTRLHAIANKEQIEAVCLYEHDGWFYQFVNWGWCCRGVKSTYNIRVGRSRAITGPYVDKEGVDLLKGGGSLLLETDGDQIGPGHPGIVHDAEKFWLSYHFYDGRENGRSKLAIRQLEWADDGWPKVGGEPIATAP